MVSKEQDELAQEIKKVHLHLRSRSQEVGPAQAWKDHLENKEMLKKYAIAMKSLAEDYWSKNNGHSVKLCRIKWISHTVYVYFQNRRAKEILKERNRLKLIDSMMECYETIETDKLKLLDVGSCYNPFKNEDIFVTFAIDLCPASEEVKQCNFLETTFCESDDNSWFDTCVTRLPLNFFDVVTFCLFLEYLPSPGQRLVACEKAWKVLKPGGVLAIVTPDSNHESAHSKLMKSWKLCLIKVGFVRFKIEKLKYLYCMAFRKTCYGSLFLQLPEYQNSDDAQILIPQDFVDYEQKNKQFNNDNFIEADIAECFGNLPEV